LVKILKKDFKLKNKLIIIFILYQMSELINRLFNDTFRPYLKTKKKASHMCGRVMGNLIFKPIS